MPTDRPASNPEQAIPGSANSNIDAIAGIYDWHEQQLTPTHLFIERASLFFGRPAYLIGVVLFMVCWIAGNLGALALHRTPLDMPPFFILQGLVTLNAFVITVAVLIRQTRMAKMAERHAHLDLQVNLMTDEKASKILTLLEQLQAEISGVRRAPDPELDELKRPVDAQAMLSAIETKHTGLQADTDAEGP